MLTLTRCRDCGRHEPQPPVTVVDGDGATSVSCALCAMAVVGDAAEPVTLVLAAAATAPLIRKDA